MSLSRLGPTTPKHGSPSSCRTPCRTSRRNTSAIAQFHDGVAEIVEPGATELNAPAYHVCNSLMVDHVRMVIGFPLQGGAASSATWQTLEYGAAQGEPRLIVLMRPRTRASLAHERARPGLRVRSVSASAQPDPPHEESSADAPPLRPEQRLAEALRMYGARPCSSRTAIRSSTWGRTTYPTRMPGSSRQYGPRTGYPKLPTPIPLGLCRI